MGTSAASSCLPLHSTGVAGLLGNKGGLVVRLAIGQTTLAFCACHLAAHEAAGRAVALSKAGSACVSRVANRLANPSLSYA